MKKSKANKTARASHVAHQRLVKHPERKKPQLKINGLHLWSVPTNSLNLGKLWVTTKTLDLESAIRKAKRFIERESGMSHAKITGVENHGTLDA